MKSPFSLIDEAAKLLRVHRRTLDNLRWKNEGPRFRRHGGRIVYELNDLLAWSEQRRARLSRQTKPKNRRLFAIAMLALGVPALTCPKASVPSLLWNLSPSVPVGLYRLTARASAEAALAVIRLPEPFITLASTRGYLPAGALLIKRVAAGAGDLVCRHGALVTINGRAVAEARPFDAAGRPLPRWSGCISLGATQIFVLSTDPDSFDSRYIRAVDRRYVLGARPCQSGCESAPSTLVPPRAGSARSNSALAAS